MAGPLVGVHVLDFTSLLPGPFSTMMLADMGAEVLKVEGPSRPDFMRLIPPFDGPESASFQAVNRNKRAIAIDLKAAEGASIARKLVETYDVVVEGFRPGVMERLGLGYEDLRAANERVIYCSISGYGQTGPYRDRAGHDNNYLAISGVTSFSSRAGESPVPQGVQIADIGGGSFPAVVAILAAIIHRDRTGEGQSIDIAMTDSALAWATPHAPAWLVGGESPKAEKEFLNGGSWYDYYRTSDGRYLSVGSIEPHFFDRLCHAIGRPDLAGQADGSDPDSWPALKAEIASAFAKRTEAEWVEIFRDVDACVEPILDFDKACANPQIVARQMIVDVPKPDGTTQPQVGSPFRFSRSKPEYRSTGPAVGQHTEAVLAEAGYSADEIETLREKMIIA